MGKQEFLDILRESLQGQLANNEVQNQIDYYNYYISSGGNRSLSESEVIKEIGDPRLIAKTIIDTTGISSDPMKSYYEEMEGQVKQSKTRSKWFSLSGLKWYQKILSAIIMVSILLLVLIVIFSILGFAFQLLFPIILIFIVLRAVTSIFRKR